MTLRFFFFFQIAFMFAVAPNMLQVQLVIIFLNLFSCETLVNNSLSQLLLNYPGENMSLRFAYSLIHVLFHTCLVTHTPLHVLDAKSEPVFMKAL